MNIDKFRLCKTEGCFKQIPKPTHTSIWPKYCYSCTNIRTNKELLSKMSLPSKTNYKWTKTGKKELTPRQKAMNSADTWFSRYIRLKHSEVIGDIIVCTCITCNDKHGIKSIDAGHYVNRDHKLVRFNENNARPQCHQCNRFKSGKHAIFGINLAKEIGIDEVDNLRQMSLFPGEDNELFYKEQAEIYRLKFKELLKEKGIKNPF